MLTNKAALDLLINTYQNFYIDSPQMLFLADLEYNLCAYSNFTIEVWDSPISRMGQSMIGINLFDSSLTRFIDKELVIQLFDEMLKTKKAITILGVNFARKIDYWVLIFEYEPVIRHDTGEVIAIQGRGYRPKYPINWYKLPSLFQHEEHCSVEQIEAKNDSFLTNREHEILFLMYNFETYEEISAIISLNNKKQITSSAVGKYIRRNLYSKFNVNDNQSLKLKAAKLNYHKKIPISLMPPTLVLNLEDL